MSKTFRTVGSGSTQTLESIENNKIPVYETKAAAEADIANLSDGQIIGTKDEGNENAKPVDVVENGNMHAVTSNAVADSLSYSTQEVKTGGKWIDGKPIYRKCYTGWSIYTKSISANLSNANVDKFVSMKGIVQGDGFVYDLNSYNSSSIFIYVSYNSSNDKFVNEVGSGYPATGSYITLYVEYTKTTDQGE